MNCSHDPAGGKRGPAGRRGRRVARRSDANLIRADSPDDPETPDDAQLTSVMIDSPDDADQYPAGPRSRPRKG